MTTKQAASGDAALKLPLPASQRARVEHWIARSGEDLSLAEAALRLIVHGLDWSESLDAVESNKSAAGSL
jgi:hypothetical protein